MKRRTVLLLLLAAFACREPEKPAPAAAAVPPEKKPFIESTADHPYDGDNLLNLAFGASVVSRTAEQNLETSAIHVLDGSPLTSWVSPPGGPHQSAVFSLPAPARIRNVGVLAPSKNVPAQVRFEASMDGKTWRDVATITCKLTPARQTADVPPFETRYLRVEILEEKLPQSILTSVHAGGELLATPAVPEIDGCWRINGVPARFVRRNARVVGAIGTAKTIFIDGGSDGRVYRLMWYRGPMWGFATVTVAPDGKTLSGLKWHEEVNPVHVGDGWFGERVPCEGMPAVNETEAAEALLKRPGRWALYGVRFDAQDRILTEDSEPALALAAEMIRRAPSRPWRIVAHEFNAGSAEQNRSRSAVRAAAVRDALRARGVDVSRIEAVGAGQARRDGEPDSTPQRVMRSVVELRTVR